jgi:hypothetical protein
MDVQPHSIGDERRADVDDDIAAFERGEAIVAAYEDAKVRAIRAIMDREELLLSHAYAQRREAINEEIAALRAVEDQRRLAAAANVLTYAASFPHRIGAIGVDPPSVWERIRTFNVAAKLYRAAARATYRLDAITASLREKRDRLDAIERETRKAVGLREEALHRRLRTPTGLRELHAHPLVAGPYAQAQAVFAERAARDAIMRRGYAFARVPLIGAAIARVERYGPLEYYVLRDLTRREYVLAADPRLEPLRDLVFDVTHGPNGYDAVVRVAANGTPMRTRAHLDACYPSASAVALDAEHRASLRTGRPTRGAPPRDDAEAELVAMLAMLADAVVAQLADA